ncbi:MAG: NepR family anti-sigma factor [Pseudomonadota bacterium]
MERLRKTPIGKALREAYQDVLNEPLPDQLTDLLNQIRESEKR